MDDQSAPSWQYIPPNSGPLPPNITVVTTTHTGETMDDKQIVLDALVEVLVDVWQDERGGYANPETYPHEFRKFCVDKLYKLLNG